MPHRCGVLFDGRAHVGGRNSGEAWIEKGLEAGEAVIVYPGDSVADDRRISIVRRDAVPR
jgi:hypothetical protein